MATVLLKPKQVDLILNLPFGKSKKLAQQGKIPCVILPDGSMRFNKKVIHQLIHPEETEVVKDEYLSLSQLAVKLELPEEYLGQLAKNGAIPFHNIEGKMVFRLISVIDSLVKLNPSDVDIDKVFELYGRLMSNSNGNEEY